MKDFLCTESKIRIAESMNKMLIDLLENAILSRFPTLTLKEIQKMIQLTPLDKTVAGQELIQMGRKEGAQQGELIGWKRGAQQGKIIGKIHLAQRLLKRPVTPKKKLLAQSPKELRAILKQLEAKLN